MANRPSLDDYIDVAERIVAFSEKYPDGSLQTLDWSVNDIAGHTFIVYRAAAYRTPDDERPGHGIAWEPFPGATPYTKNSELMNAETAAWGRAIVALGLPANRKIASKQEVKARQEEQANGNKPATQTMSGEELKKLRDLYGETGWDAGELRIHLVAVGVQDAADVRNAMRTLSRDQALELVQHMSGAIDEAARLEEARLEGALDA